MVLKGEEPRRPRGRPVSGRKNIVQIGIDDEIKGFMDAIAAKERTTISTVGRMLIEEAIEVRKRRRSK